MKGGLTRFRAQGVRVRVVGLRGATTTLRGGQGRRYSDYAITVVAKRGESTTPRTESTLPAMVSHSLNS